MAPDGHHITRLLREWSDGREAAAEELLSLVYPALRRIAARRLGDERREHTLQPTALVNEAYLRLVAATGDGFRDRAHFFGFAAHLMRNILVDHARRRRARKRGGDAVRVTLSEDVRDDAGRAVEIYELDLALERLGEIDPRAEKIVELKFFAGLSIEEIAELVAISPATVKRDWSAARAFLYRELATG